MLVVRFESLMLVFRGKTENCLLVAVYLDRCKLYIELEPHSLCLICVLATVGDKLRDIQMSGW